MKTYGQYCPIARASEVLGERWTPIILRNMRLGANTFNAISAGAPGLSRALLTKRLRELARAGVVESRPKPDGHGNFYELTDAGRDAWRVLRELGNWGDQWTDVLDEHADVGVVLWNWTVERVADDRLPEDRAQIRIDHVDRRGRAQHDWLLADNGTLEVCRFDPGFGDDVIITLHDTTMFAKWHLGLITWASAVRSGAIEVSGDRATARAIPTWNNGPVEHQRLRAAIPGV